MYPCSTKRREGLENPSPTPKISRGHGFCTPRPEGFPEGEARGKSRGSRGAKPMAKGNLEGGGDGFSNPSRVLVEHGHSLIITREGFFIVNLIKTQWKPTISNENQQVSMNERFAFDDICICVFGYFVSAYFCIFVQNSYLYFICVCHNHHHLFCSSTLLFMRAKEREIRSFRIHYDDGNIFLFISVADWSFWRF